MIQKLAQYTDIKCGLIVGGLSVRVYGSYLSLMFNSSLRNVSYNGMIASFAKSFMFLVLGARGCFEVYARYCCRYSWTYDRSFA